MSKRIIAAFMVALFVLGAALTAAPTWAHTTLGMQTDGSDPNGMYRIHDVETNFGHVPGVTGYVFPGGGKDWYTGNIPPVQEYPGYQSPWTNYPPNAPYMTWWQLRGTSYTPFGAILASTEETQNIGDLIFAVNFTTEGIPGGWKPSWPIIWDTVNFNYTKLTIYIPPEFVPVNVDWEAGKTDNIVSTIPGEDISVKRADVKDPFGPSWWVISIEGDIKFLEAHEWTEWYYVRVNSVAAPKIAGRYFFKMFLNDSYPRVLCDPNKDGKIDNFITSTMPVENYPVLLVKGEIDPGIAFGTVRFGGYDPDLYGQPIPLAGCVRFVGTAMDPYTGELTGRKVEARGYFNGTANGHYEVEGIAPGRYDVYASAAGYPEVKVAEGVEVLPGKSLHLDIYLNPGAIIHGTIFAKHNWGEAKWSDTPAWQWMGKLAEILASKNDRKPPDPFIVALPVSVEIYDSNEWPEPTSIPGGVWGDVDGTVPDHWMIWERGTPTDLKWTDTGYQPSSMAHLKSFSPINLTDSPFTSYDWDEQNGLPNPVDVAFPWDAVYGIAVRHNGVGPAQDWWAGDDAWEVSSFRFQFGEKDMAKNVIYGAPTGYDGHVPQVFATWTNGLTPGTYYARVWIPGFVQADASGFYVDYKFTVSADEWAGDVTLWIDVQLNGWIEKEVHFHNLPGTIATAPIQGPDPWRWLIAEARDAQGTLVAFNAVPVGADQDSAWIPLWGFGLVAPDFVDVDGDGDWELYLYSLYNYRHIRDYGMMPGTYKIYVYMRGYVQQEFEMASITLSGSPTYISNHMYRGAGINVTVYSMDSEMPPIFRDWIFPGEDITITVKNKDTNVSKGDVKYWDNTAGEWKTPTQVEGQISVPPIPGWVPGWSKLKFNGSTALEENGPDPNKYAVSLYDPYDEKYNVPGGFLADPSMYRDADFNTTVALESGRYYFAVSTKGYVFKDADKFTVYAQKGYQADGPLKLVIGAHLDVTVLFKKEGVFYHVPWNITMTIHVFNKDGTEVASETVEVPESTESQGVTIWGLDAYPNYDGEWTIETETYVKYWGEYMEIGPSAFYQGLPPGLLMGKGMRVVAGEVRGATPFNHLGPYQQRLEVTVPNVQLGGEASVQYELDLMGYLYGQIAGYTWSNELRTISWADVAVSGAAGDFTVYSFDGAYEMFMVPGDYKLTIEEWPGGVGHKTASTTVTVPDGGAVGQNFLNLERSNIAIPEFPVALLPTLAALGASLYLLKRRKE